MTQETSPLRESIRTTLKGFTSYRFRTGQLSFILHRLTGLGTLLFLTFHILDTATVYFVPQLYGHAIALYRTTPMMLLEIVLVFSVIYHGVNGARIAIFDLLAPKRWRAGSSEKTALATLAVAILLWLPAAFMMGRNILLYNF